MCIVQVTNCTYKNTKYVTTELAASLWDLLDNLSFHQHPTNHLDICCHLIVHCTVVFSICFTYVVANRSAAEPGPPRQQSKITGEYCAHKHTHTHTHTHTSPPLAVCYSPTHVSTSLHSLHQVLMASLKLTLSPPCVI